MKIIHTIMAAVDFSGHLLKYARYAARLAKDGMQSYCSSIIAYAGR